MAIKNTGNTVPCTRSISLTQVSHHNLQKWGMFNYQLINTSSHNYKCIRNTEASSRVRKPCHILLLRKSTAEIRGEVVRCSINNYSTMFLERKTIDIITYKKIWATLSILEEWNLTFYPNSILANFISPYSANWIKCRIIHPPRK